MRMLHRFEYLNTQSPVGGTTSKTFGGRFPLEEKCHWRQSLKFQSRQYSEGISLCFLLLNQI